MGTPVGSVQELVPTPKSPDVEMNSPYLKREDNNEMSLREEPLAGEKRGERRNCSYICTTNLCHCIGRVLHV